LEALYDEIRPDGLRLLDEHLAACEACRRERDELRGTSRAVGDYEPDRPDAPRVVVLEPPRRTIGSWPSFAGGVAAAAALLAIGFAIGALWSPPGEDPTARPVPATVAEQDVVSREHLDAALAAFESRLREEGDQGRAAMRDEILETVRADVVTPDALDARLGQFDAAVNERRRRDLKYVLNEIAASELRAGAVLGETRQAVRYLAAARQPEASEW
jgi:hypothetical protein